MTIVQAQFLDGISALELDIPAVLTKPDGSRIVSGSSVNYEDQDVEGVALRLEADGEPKVDFYFLDSAGVWSAPQLGKIFSEPFSNRYMVTFRTEMVEKSTAFKYEISLAGGEAKVLAGGLMLKDHEIYPQGKFPPMRPRTGAVDKPRIISREEWGARPPKYDFNDHPYFDKLTLHHAAGFSASSLESGKIQVRAIQDFHQDGRGWNDIGYHFVVDMDGNIYQGRPETVIGAHVGGANTGNIGVCILGCYHPPEQNWPCFDNLDYSTERALIKLYAWISDTYDYNPQVLLGHRDYFNRTSCPGDNVWPLIPNMRTDISLFMEFGEQPTRFALFQNYPNPFNSSTTLHYDLPENLPVKITIYDVAGREIRILVNEEQHSGYKKVIWNGFDGQGEKVPSGIYLYKVSMGNFSEINKMVLIK